MGPLERRIAQDAYRSGEPIPDRIQNAPVLQDGLELYLNAFFELDTERSHNMGATPIPFTSIVKYAELFDFDDRQTDSLLAHIRGMDGDNLERVRKAQKG